MGAMGDDFNPAEPIPVPHLPPRDWFESVPEWWDPDTALIQIKLDGPEAGRVAALVAPEGECYLGNGPGGGCWKAPKSATNYEYAHVGSTVTAEGDQIRTAAIAGNLDHASTAASLSFGDVVNHYNSDTSTRRFRVRYRDLPGVGVVAVGAIEPGTTKWEGISAMSSALSGDWRYVQSLRQHEMTGSQLVNNPAFRPVPRRQQARYAVTAALPEEFAVTAGMCAECADEALAEAPMIGQWEPAPDHHDDTERRHVTFDADLFLAKLASIEDKIATLLLRTVEDEPIHDDTGYTDVFGEDTNGW